MDTGLGARVDPYQFEDDQLISAVESVMANQTIRDRMKAAAKRIQNSNRHEELVDKIEQLLRVETENGTKNACEVA